MFKFIFKVPILLLLVLLLLLIVLYLKFLWTRRDIIIKSWNFPGPINFPVIGASYVFMCHPEYILNQILKLAKKNPGGCKLWFLNQMIYVICEPDQIEKILGSRKYVEKKFFYNHIIDAIGSGLLQAPEHIWRPHRKGIAPSFNQKALDSFVEVFWKKSLILSQCLEKELNQEIDMFHLLSRCTLDIIGETSMGLNLNTQTENLEIAQTFDKIMLMIYLKMFQLWNQFPIIWKLLGHKKIMDQRLKRCNDLIDKVITEKTKLMENAKNNPMDPKKYAFLDCMIEKKFPAKEIRDEVMLFIMAGTDTTASSLAFLYTMLGLYPDVQQKVYEEVIQVLGKDRAPLPSDLPNLTYTERVIKENLRLFPVGAIFARQITEEIDMGSFIIPKGVTVHFPLLHIQRNPEYFPDPLKFDPDRFLPEEVAKRPPCTFIPFSYGPRGCIGKTYAMMNMKVMIACLIRKFVFHTNYEKFDDIKIKANVVLRFCDGSRVWLSERK